MKRFSLQLSWEINEAGKVSVGEKGWSVKECKNQRVRFTRKVARIAGRWGAQEDDEYLFFGYVIGLEEEWEYFASSEMETVRGPGGLTIERDIHFKPGPFGQIIDQSRREHPGQVLRPTITGSH
jgi:hypothetical protein